MSKKYRKATTNNKLTRFKIKKSTQVSSLYLSKNILKKKKSRTVSNTLGKWNTLFSAVLSRLNKKKVQLMLFSFTWRKLFPAGHEWRFLWCVDTLFDPRATLRMPSMPKPIKSTKLTQGKWGFMQQGQQLRLLAAEKNKLNTMTVGKFVQAQCIERIILWSVWWRGHLH